MTTSAPPRARPRPRERCPSCGLPAQRGQLICLSCGTRMALERHRSDPRAVAAAGGSVALVALVVLTMIVTTLAGGDDPETPAGGEERQAANASRERPARAARAAPPRSPERTLVRYKTRVSRERAATIGDWPAGQQGWTVVLSNAYDQQTAEGLAQDVEEGGTPAGVISSTEHPALGTGLWVVYSGVYADQLEAGEAAAELQATYPSAYVQFVE